MGSLSYLLTPSTNLYLAAGRGMDTPTLNQIKYGCSDASCTTVAYTPVFLDASTTNQYEVGIKQKIPGIASISVAIFQADSQKEIMVLKNISGKSTYTNANQTRRQGIELAGQFKLPYDFGATLSYTYLMAKVVDDYQLYTGSRISAGSYIPGVPKQKIFGDLYWRKPDQTIDVGVELLSVSGMVANDTNSAGTNGYTVINGRIALKQKVAGWTFSEFARVNNIGNRYYVGSVIVNQSSSQYYEPAPGRNWVIGAKASYKF
jgi:iron complex outermembrane receptor protein